MFANVKLTSPDSRRTLWLPSSAVATSDLPQVLMVEDDHVVYRKVQIGRRDNGTLEIVSGLDEGEQVIKNVAGLTRGLPVKVIG
jgi:multidrug efflux pump subunit AcrA (membrane-fusion protein)